MTLTKHLLARLKDQGLHVEGPWQEGKSGWLGRYTVAKGPWEEGAIRVLHGPILRIYEEDSFWIAQKHEWIPGPGPTDFRCKYANCGRGRRQSLAVLLLARVWTLVRHWCPWASM